MRSHVVIGIVVSNNEWANAKWAACDLAKVVVGPEELALDAQGTSIRISTDQKSFQINFRRSR